MYSSLLYVSASTSNAAHFVDEKIHNTKVHQPKQVKSFYNTTDQPTEAYQWHINILPICLCCLVALLLSDMQGPN